MPSEAFPYDRLNGTELGQYASARVARRGMRYVHVENVRFLDLSVDCKTL